MATALMDRDALRRAWLDEAEDSPESAALPRSPIQPAVAPWAIHRLLVEMASGTQPCTSCCTQCSSNCCNASQK